MFYKIFIVDSTLSTEKIEELIPQIQNFLNDLQCDYPHFEDWLSKIFGQIKKNKRAIVLALDNKTNVILGITILKTTEEEKKICTIRVDNQYRSKGIGKNLIETSLNILGTKYPLVTVSELRYKEFMPVFKSFGFKLVDKIKSVYHTGIYEYYFNIPYKHKYALLSIKPEYALKIMDGLKSVEFRKQCFRNTVSRVYVYASDPIQKIIGYFDVLKIDNDSPSNLWSKYRDQGCLSLDKFNSYYQHKEKGNAIIIDKVVGFSQKLSLKECFHEGFKAPQNFCYIDNVDVIEKLKLLS